MIKPQEEDHDKSSTFLSRPLGKPRGFEKVLDKAILHLKKDKVMKKILSKYSIEKQTKYMNSLFVNLIDSIISQQLSNKAAFAISKRFKSIFNSSPISPALVLSTPDVNLKKSGLSAMKTVYIKGLAKAIESKTIDVDSLHNLSDEDVIVQLTKLKGIGRWTAEMFLIFSLKRPDIFSVGDLGLRTAVSKWYGVEIKDLKRIEEISKKWSPYRSFASRILWKSLEN